MVTRSVEAASRATSDVSTREGHAMARTAQSMHGPGIRMAPESNVKASWLAEVDPHERRLTVEGPMHAQTVEEHAEMTRTSTRSSRSLPIKPTEMQRAMSGGRRAAAAVGRRAASRHRGPAHPSQRRSGAGRQR